jgi:hypothetical protein
MIGGDVTLKGRGIGGMGLSLVNLGTVSGLLEGSKGYAPNNVCRRMSACGSHEYGQVTYVIREERVVQRTPREAELNGWIKVYIWGTCCLS